MDLTRSRLLKYYYCTIYFFCTTQHSANQVAANVLVLCGGTRQTTHAIIIPLTSVLVCFAGLLSSVMFMYVKVALFFIV